MPSSYRTPGVYREELFLQPQARLPTGVPGFVGFADAIVALVAAPPGVQFPDSLPNSLKGKVQYQNKFLRFSDKMTATERDQLLVLSSESRFQAAIADLFRLAQTGFDAPILLQRRDEFFNRFAGIEVGFLAEAVNGFFENGGTRCYLVRVRPGQTAQAWEAALKMALTVLETVNDLDLVAIPDAMMLSDPSAVNRVQQAMLAHCRHQGDRLALLDALPESQATEILSQRERILLGQIEPINAALYYPWIRNAKGKLVPPSGHVAGIFARSDRTRGVFKAPANEEILDALDLETIVDNSIQADLNPNNINCLRIFPGRGIRVWGARTLSQDETWRYVNVRRLVLTIERWIDQNMAWATFEPNSPRLWVRIQRELSTYLEGLWRAGALQGQTAGQAFYVKCDTETNPPESRETGAVVTEIGLAASAPAEFIIVRIIRRAADSVSA